MKLKCETHNRRVMVLDNAKVLHRNDGSECKTERVAIGLADYTPELVLKGFADD
jgi:hypothetical protein